MNRKNPLIPMAAITGRPDRARAEEVLRAYKSVGIEQFLIYPRSGLEYEYMSPEWLQLCRDFVEVAAELDMDIWLYDEYNYPSGNCRGQVTAEHDALYPNALVFERQDGKLTSRVVRNRYGADILNPEAVSRFLALTHQRYYDELKDYFGSVIKGIFTDEPSFGYFTNNGGGTFEAHVAEGSFALAWYDGLEGDYAAVRGGNLSRDVMAYIDGNCPEYLWEDYFRLMGERMRAVYVGSMNDWCVRHGIVLTGHLMCEVAADSVYFNGNALKMLSAFSLPGMDEIPSQISIDSHDVEFCALSFVQYAGQGKGGQLAELFALGPADLPVATMRQMIWMTACYGVDHYVLAVAALDPKGNIDKNGYYFPTSKTQPWFEHYPELGESATVAAECARKPYEPEIRLRYPVSLFMRVKQTSAHDRMSKLYNLAMEELVRHQVQYLFLDEGEETHALVASMDEDGLYIEGEDKRFDDAVAFADHLTAKMARRCVVWGEDGREVRDVLVRRWADGCVALVDLTDNDEGDRLLTVTLDGQVRRVRLAGHGVFCGGVEEMSDSPVVALERAAIRDLALVTESENIMRCVYTRAEPRVSINVRDRLEGVRLLLRVDPDPVKASLDGLAVEAIEADDRLPDGFAPLYRASEPFALERGMHTLSIDNAAIDHRYLPGAFFVGAFDYDRAEGLAARSGRAGIGRAVGIDDYVGSYRITGAIDVPRHEGIRLWLDTNMACTELLMDGESLGVRSWSPFEWAIPKTYQGGAHELTVRVTTSIMPLFGDIATLEAEQPYLSWVRVRPGAHTRTGIMQAPVWMAEAED